MKSSIDCAPVTIYPQKPSDSLIRSEVSGLSLRQLNIKKSISSNPNHTQNFSKPACSASQSQSPSEPKKELQSVWESPSREWVQPDLIATLVCQREDAHWHAHLTEFLPKISCRLVGRDVTVDTVLPIDAFIPEQYCQEHQVWLDSILTEGKNSPHWTRLMGRMLGNRYIRVKNPGYSCPVMRTRQVAITMDLIEEKTDFFAFKVTFYDNTETYQQTSQLGQLTHDLRGYFNSIRGENRLMLDALQQLTLCQEGQQSMAAGTVMASLIERLKISSSNIDELAHGGILACAPSCSSLMKRKEKEDEHMIEDINDVFEKRLLKRLILVNEPLKQGQVSLQYQTSNQLFLAHHAVIALEGLVYNLVKNAAHSGAKNIQINTCNQDESYQCDVIDDGPGLPKHMQGRFFHRRLDEPSKSDTPLTLLSKEPCNQHDVDRILANRGEGTILATQAWHNVGGAIEEIRRTDGLSGAYFRATIFGKRRPCCLLPEHIHFIDEKKAHLRGLILLVDDSLAQVKIMMRRLIPDVSVGSQAFVNMKWSKDSLVFIEHEKWVFACAGGAEIALDLAKKYPPTAIISDHELGNESSMKGADFLLAISKQIKPLPKLAIHSESSQEDLLRGHPQLIDCNLTFLKKGDQNISKKLDVFLSECHVPSKMETRLPLIKKT